MSYPKKLSKISMVLLKVLKLHQIDKKYTQCVNNNYEKYQTKNLCRVLPIIWPRVCETTPIKNIIIVIIKLLICL